MQCFKFLLSASSKAWTLATYKIIIKYLNEYVKMKWNYDFTYARNTKKKKKKSS